MDKDPQHYISQKGPCYDVWNHRHRYGHTARLHLQPVSVNQHQRDMGCIILLLRILIHIHHPIHRFPVQKPQGTYVPSIASTGLFRLAGAPRGTGKEPAVVWRSLYYVAKRFFTKYAVISRKGIRSEFSVGLSVRISSCMRPWLFAARFPKRFIPAMGIQPLSYHHIPVCAVPSRYPSYPA